MCEIQSRNHGRFVQSVQAPVIRESILAAIRLGATQQQAAKQANVTRMTLNRWMRADEQFAAAVQAAKLEARRPAIAAAVAAYHASKAAQAA